MADLTKLKESCEKLVSLLNDPQPGMVSWNGFVGERIDEIEKEIKKAKSPHNPL